MALPDTSNSFGTVSRINHAFSALIIIAMLALGLYFEDLPRGEEKIFWLRLHISIGTTAWLLLAFRLYWRAKNGFPDPFPQARALQILTHAVHGLLMLGILILMITGPLAVWSGGRGIGIFGLFSIPSPMGEVKWLHDLLGGIHGVVAKAMMILIIAHVLGALKHLVMDRAEFVGRMMGKRQRMG
jgi:cytochrome b561